MRRRFGGRNEVVDYSQYKGQFVNLSNAEVASLIVDEMVAEFGQDAVYEYLLGDDAYNTDIDDFYLGLELKYDVFDFYHHLEKDMKIRRSAHRGSVRKRTYYDSMSDSTTPMSQSELAAEAEAVFDIVFDEDPDALFQSGAYEKIFDYFKRYGISNDYNDAVDMAFYIEEFLLIKSHRARRKVASAQEELMDLVDWYIQGFHEGSYSNFRSFLRTTRYIDPTQIVLDQLEDIIDGSPTLFDEHNYRFVTGNSLKTDAFNYILEKAGL